MYNNSPVPLPLPVPPAFVTSFSIPLPMLSAHAFFRGVTVAHLGHLQLCCIVMKTIAHRIRSSSGRKPKCLSHSLSLIDQSLASVVADELGSHCHDQKGHRSALSQRFSMALPLPAKGGLFVMEGCLPPTLIWSILVHLALDKFFV